MHPELTLPAAPTAAPAAGGARAFLDETVREFASKFGADRCTIYLYDDATQTLAMQAAFGYPMFGKATVVLRLGEGTVGSVLAQRRPIYADDVSTRPEYIAHANFPASEFLTFLGIPLLRGRERLGVIAMRRRTGNPFPAETIFAARERAAEIVPMVTSARAMLLAEKSTSSSTSAGAATVAGAISTAAAAAAASIPLSLTTSKKPAPLPDHQLDFQGVAVTKGWAMGAVRLLKPTNLGEGLSNIKFPPAIRTLPEALARVESSLAELVAHLEERLPEAASLLLEATKMLLKDDAFSGQIGKLSEQGMPLTDAIVKVARDTIRVFKSSSLEYLTEKAQDVEDLALRLIDAATEPDTDNGTDDFGASAATAVLRAGAIVVADHVLPTDVLRLARDRVGGLVLGSGGATAHVSLLVRSLNIPTLRVSDTSVFANAEGERAILDCGQSKIWVHPDPDLHQRYSWRRGEEEKARREEAARPAVPEKSVTRDGVDVELRANINILTDLNAARENKAQGIGLYRTEFPFLMRPTTPEEETQFSIYRRLLVGMPNHPVVFRTLDAGGDKVIPYLAKKPEENPALGLRSVRFTLKYTHVFEQQLHAILRAIQMEERDDVCIMFPMVASLEEFRRSQEIVAAQLAAVRAELGDRPIHEPILGAMIEVPSVLTILDELAEEVSFFSVGTNDLIQYLLAVDRTNAAVADYYVPHHPAVLRSLAHIAEVGNAHEIPVSVCGEMGRDPRYLPFLLGIGIRSISLEPTQIPSTRALVSRLTIERCEAYANELLGLATIEEIEAAINRFAEETFA